MKNTLFIGKKIIELVSVDSTNNYLSNLAKTTNVMDGTVILAQKQTKGKGQRGNSWESEDNKNLSFSVFLNLNFISIENNFLISIMISNSLHELTSAYCINSKIKWPNDIYVENLKIAGILIESSVFKNRIKNTIIGIGLNINQLNFSPNINATSLKKETEKEFEISNIANELCSLIEKNYFLLKNGKIKELKSYYFNNLLGYRKEREFIVNREKIIGEITTVKNNGFLEIESNNSIYSFDMKEIEFVI